MTTLPDTFFGIIAYKNGLLTKEEIARVVAEQEEDFEYAGMARTFGEICLDNGLLSEEEVDRILDAQEKSTVLLEDTLYGKIAVRNELVTTEQIDEALNLQRQEKYERRIGEILVEKGYLTEQEVHAILRTQRRLSSDEDSAED